MYRLQTFVNRLEYINPVHIMSFSITCIVVWSVRRSSCAFGCLGKATLFDHDTPRALHITTLLYLYKVINEQRVNEMIILTYIHDYKDTKYAGKR